MSDTPDTKSTAAKAMAGAIQVCRDVAAGFERVKEYLPQHPKEKPENYLIRKNRRTFFNAFGRTCDGLTGMIFRRDVKLGDDVPEAIRDHWENIDFRGTHGDVFCAGMIHDAIEAGHSVVLVDMPYVPKGLNAAQEKQLNVRPYWVRYKPEDVYSVRSSRVGGRTVLDQIVLHEETVEADGAFGDKLIDRYRVFRRSTASVEWEVWTKRTQDGKEGLFKDSNGVLGNQAEIPVSVCYGKRTGYFESKPPLKGLADLNLLHYETNSDYHHAAHIANVPVPVVIGVSEDEQLVIGPNAALMLPEGADAKYLETQGSALGHTRLMLQDIEQNMATLGLNFLARDPRSAETATAKRLNRSESDSALAAIARSCEDAVEAALQYHANYLKEKTGGSVEINKDYEDQCLTPEEVNSYLLLRQSGEISRETLWAILYEGERLPPDFDVDDETLKLDAEGFPSPVDAV